MKKYIDFDILSVDAYDEYGTGGNWVWNYALHIGKMKVEDCRDDVKAFKRWLWNHGVKLRGFEVVSDGEILEVCNRESGEPVFAAVPNC